MSPSREETRPTSATRDPAKRDTLANLYQGFFTGIVRLQARRQPLGDPQAFRARMKAALKAVRKEAAALGYPIEDINDTEFAVVAFLDEVILTSDDPGRDVWAKQTLSVELYGEAIAGEVFFEKIDSLWNRPDSQGLAALFEVYLMCLLLGYEGRYAGMKGEIHAITSRLRRRLDSIRQPDARLTPEAVPPLDKHRPARPKAPVAQWKRLALLAMGAALVLFLIFKANLWWGVRALESAVAK